MQLLIVHEVCHVCFVLSQPSHRGRIGFDEKPDAEKAVMVGNQIIIGSSQDTTDGLSDGGDNFQEDASGEIELFK